MGRLNPDRRPSPKGSVGTFGHLEPRTPTSYLSSERLKESEGLVQSPMDHGSQVEGMSDDLRFLLWGVSRSVHSTGPQRRGKRKNEGGKRLREEIISCKHLLYINKFHNRYYNSTFRFRLSENYINILFLQFGNCPFTGDGVSYKRLFIIGFQ